MKLLALVVMVAACACGGDDEPASKGRFVVEVIKDGLVEPVDAALSPDGETVYYITRGGDAGLFEVSASGTRKLESFTGAHALAISNDGRTLFIADDDHGIITLRPDGSLGRTNLPGTSNVLAPRLFVGSEICVGNGRQIDCIPIAGGPSETVVDGYVDDVRGVVLAAGDHTYATTSQGVFEAKLDEFPEKIADVVGTGSIALSLTEEEVLVPNVADGGAQVTISDRTTGATVEVFSDVIGKSATARCLARAPQSDVYVFCGDDAVYRLKLR